MDLSSGTLLVLYGDTPLLTTETLSRLLKQHLLHANAVTVLGSEFPDPGQYGRLLSAGYGKLESIIEARDATEKELEVRICNSGVMAIDLDRVGTFFGAMSNNNAAREYYLTDIVEFARDGKYTCGFMLCDPQEVSGANDRQELSDLEQLFQQGKRSCALENGVTLVDPCSVYFSFDTRIEPDVTIEPHVFFGPGTTVRSTACIRSFSHIEGAIVSEGAVVGPYARLRPGTHIGENAKVGNFVEIKKTKIGKSAKVPHLTYLGDATLGDRVNIGAGTITCNYDGFDKHPTLIGADAFVGSNSTLIAPVEIGLGAIVAGGSVITENVGGSALAFGRAPQSQKSLGAVHFRNRKQIDRKAG